MFAVPGWSVSVKDLKTQTEPLSHHQAQGERSTAETGVEKKFKKRKRDQKRSSGNQITEENIGDLWKNHLESQSKSVKLNEEVDGSGGQQKRQKIHGNNVSKGNEGSSSQQKHKKAQNGTEKGGESNNLLLGKLKSAEQERYAEIPNTTTSNEDGLAKYQRRKAKAERKRQPKTTQQAGSRNGQTQDSESTDALKSVSRNYHESKPHKPSNPPHSASPPTAAPNPPLKSKPSLKSLTPLQQKMAQKLTSARFRHLNETLYTSPSDSALSLFTKSPQAYTAYHAGFRAQVAVWPSNPVLEFVQEVQTRGAVTRDRGSQAKAWRDKLGKKSKLNGKGKRGAGGEENDGSVIRYSDGQDGIEPLPRDRRTGSCTIADLGCGDATLAASLLSVSGPRKLNLRLLSFDLAKGDTPNADLVTVADITRLGDAGVSDGSVDVAICCLSLMGTNWVRVVHECTRVVRTGGEVWVAEIKSRFVRRGEKTSSAKTTGKKTKGSKKGGGSDEDPDGDEKYASELEENPGVKDETDVSAFVDVWRNREFALKGEPDRGNKMFVKMKFVKERGQEGGTQKNGQREDGRRLKFLDDKDGDEDSGERVLREGKVLKPCVYKTR